MTKQIEIGQATHRGAKVLVTVEVWSSNGHTYYTPKCREFGLGGRDFSTMGCAVRYAKRVASI
jgi:hypothetical protein